MEKHELKVKIIGIRTGSCLYKGTAFTSEEPDPDYDQWNADQEEMVQKAIPEEYHSSVYQWLFSRYYGEPVWDLVVLAGE